MRFAIAAVGRLKDGPERELLDRYRARLDALGRSHAFGPLAVTETAESRAAQAAARCDEEADRLLASVSGDLIVMDERGRSLTSSAFAADLRKRRDSGTAAVTFLIGGPDGHGEAVRRRAALLLSLGPMTLPHGLARVVLVEQLYRAVTIAAGHPYHRT